MCGLPQAGILANKCLAKDGYYQAPHTPGPWRHAWQPVQFTLVAGNFGAECFGGEHVIYLAKALTKHMKPPSIGMASYGAVE
jgi:hypothetical protein